MSGVMFSKPTLPLSRWSFPCSSPPAGFGNFIWDEGLVKLPSKNP